MILLRKWYSAGVPGHGTLFAEGAIVTALGVLVAWWLFPEEAGIVAVFLASISTHDTMERVLAENRAAILERGVRPARANGRLTGLILALFAGSLVAFGAFGLLLPFETMERLFDRQFGYGELPLFPNMHFGGFGDLFLNNVYVVLFFFLVSLAYRQGGVMLAVAWNASMWGPTFAGMARRWSEEGGPPLPEAVLRVTAASAPHMALEGVAYVGAGLAGVFASRAIEKYSLDSPVAASIARSVSAMLAGAVVLVALGAWCESELGRMLVRALS